MVPFTRDDFFAVFAAYNTAVWPAQWLLVGLALAAAFAALSERQQARAWISATLVALWAWMGLVYHLWFFRTINPAAGLFGAAFLVQAGLFAWIGLRRGQLVFRPRIDVRGIAGGAMLGYALLVYPMLGAAFGHHYPATPTFGAPCPTTIFTFGLLLWTVSPVPWWLLVIPALWAAIGLSAALSLGVPQDVGLFLAGAIAIPMLLRRPRSGAATTA